MLQDRASGPLQPAAGIRVRNYGSKNKDSYRLQRQCGYMIRIIAVFSMFSC